MNDRAVTPTAALFLVTLTTGLACANEPAAPTAETTTKRAAVTAAPPSQARRLLANDIGPWQGGAAIQAIPMPAMRLPGQPKGTAVAKPVLAATVGTPPSAPAAPAAYVAKQNEYLRQWNALQPTIATLSVAEQDARRAALKRQVVGE